MTPEELVIERFRNRGFVMGSKLFLRPPVATQFVEACESVDLASVGVEGFLRIGDVVEAQMDLIADFSDIEDGRLD